VAAPRGCDLSAGDLCKSRGSRLPDQPNFVAEFSDCSFNIHLVDDEIAFQPPAGAEQVALKSAVTPAPGKEGGK